MPAELANGIAAAAVPQLELPIRAGGGVRTAVGMHGEGMHALLVAKMDALMDEALVLTRTREHRT